RFGRMVQLAVLSSVISSVLGILISYWSDSSPAGCIVLVQTGLCVLAFLLAPRYGILMAPRSQTS
ncbi:MAG: metal ABC transporter permease, partial [Cyanobacteriota bacterium]|nr:metal ABC transporter permease [Cyanobacteriota bacterium]